MSVRRAILACHIGAVQASRSPAGRTNRIGAGPWQLMVSSCACLAARHRTGEPSIGGRSEEALSFVCDTAICCGCCLAGRLRPAIPVLAVVVTYLRGVKCRL